MIQHGICNLSIVPCRAEPSDRSEMVTQLLFGEHFEILAAEGSWSYIRIAADQYECWVDRKQYLPISQESFEELQVAPLYLAGDMIQLITKTESADSFPVTLGCRLPFYSGGLTNLQGIEYSYEGSVVHAPSFSRKLVVETALTLLNSPYLWGGRTLFGIDCSGFVQLVYRMAGLQLPRDASQQALTGEVLSFPEEALEGDLAFFDNQAGRITHVGIIMRDSRIIHASGKVRIDKFDHYGIFNEETGQYTHHLRLIRNVTGE